MLDDPKSERLIRNFVGQWLGARRVGAHAVSPDVYPEWTPALANAMAEEMYQYVLEFFRERPLVARLSESGRQLRRWRAGAALRHERAGPRHVSRRSDQRQPFGVSGSRRLSGLELVRLPDGSDAARALDLDQSSCARLRKIRRRTFPHSTSRPDPPTPRSRTCAHGSRSIERIQSVPAATPRMDPYGIALENFDAIGKYRATYRNGSPIDASAALPDGTKLQGLPSVADVVSARPQFTACVTENLFTYSLGRGVEKTDEPVPQPDRPGVAARQADAPPLGRRSGRRGHLPPAPRRGGAMSGVSKQEEPRG